MDMTPEERITVLENNYEFIREDVKEIYSKWPVLPTGHFYF